MIQDHLEFIIRWRDDGVRTFVNESYCRYWGAKPRNSLAPVSCRRFLKKTRTCCAKSWRPCRLAIPLSSMTIASFVADGRITWVHWTHRALFNEQQELIEYQSVGCDITDRRQQEEHKQARAVASGQLQALTEREHDVMRLVVAGDPNKVMARKLALSIKTIEKHRGSLMKKLHVRSVPELVRLAMLVDESVDS